MKRFSGGRAWVSMKLENPIDLLRALEENAPFDFVVRDTRSNGVVLDVDGDGRTGPRGVGPTAFVTDS